MNAHTHTNSNIRSAALLRAIATLACLFALSEHAVGDTITLKTSARLRTNLTAIALSDIAVLSGDEALRLANTEVGSVKASNAVMEIAVADVRKALDAAGVNWAKVNLSGRAVLVRPARDPHAAPPQAMAPAAIDHKPTSDTKAADAAPQALTLNSFISEQTIRGSIASLIVTNLRIDPRDLRVRFEDRDAQLLQTPMASARFEIQPLGSLRGDRLEFAVRGWQGSTAKQVGQITLFVERRVNAMRVKEDMPRDSALADDDLETTEMWLAQGEAINIAPRASIVGRTLSRSLHAGDMIRVRDLQRESLVKRGDLVTVRCLVGGVAISLQAEAKADGSEGEAIEFRKTGERETFLATVTGRNQAMVDLARR